MTDVSPYNQRLAGHTALVIAAMHHAHGAPAGGAWPVTDLLRVTAEVACKNKLGVTGSRHVAARQHIVCYAALYARRFHPGHGHALAAAPDRGAARLIWAGPAGQVTVDALDCGNATSPVLTDAGTGLAEAAQTGATVRFVRLAAPHTSRRWSAGRWQPLTGDQEPADRAPDHWALAPEARAAS